MGKEKGLRNFQKVAATHTEDFLKETETTIVIAEDHFIVRQALAALLSREPGFRVVGEAGDGLEAVEIVSRQKPAILVLDLMLPRLHGLGVIRQLQAGPVGTRIVVLTIYADEASVAGALNHGASAYVLKDSGTSSLIEAIHFAKRSKRYLSPEITEKAVDALLQKPFATRGEGDGLTERERLVLQYAAEGFSNSEVAQRMYISVRTVETHRAHLMRKLGLKSQTDLVRYAIRQKLIAA